MHPDRGFTLIELLLVLAVLAITIGIAIPVYHGYMAEARISTARHNAASLRLFLEDYQLSHGAYTTTGEQETYTTSQIATHYGWSPDGGAGTYTYTLTADVDTWDITVVHDSGAWLLCANRMAQCCSGLESSSQTDSCP
jgi:type IV pilus assembly protein PilE